MSSQLRDRGPFNRAASVLVVVRALRPRQWLKNLLVFAAPIGAGKLLTGPVLAPTVLAFVAFCLVASGSYLVNDVLDSEADRAHPHKRHRPVAAGTLSVRAALLLASGLFAAGLAIGFGVRPALGLTVTTYVLATTTYSLWLKQVPVLELALLSLGFLLRAVAGGTATGLPLSAWFLVVAVFGSLFMAAGKRVCEMQRLNAGLPIDGDDEPVVWVRRSLGGYTAQHLRWVWTSAAAFTIAGYCLWALDNADRPSSLPWALMSVVPFVLAVLRYAVDIRRGAAEAPELVVLSDRVLLLLGLLWLVLFGLGARGV
ncbi:MAG: decaprenyl-phosphate phosphoribosyltransferase [Actinomycetes bacterium]